jgi:polyhydroxyalkanoate synthesis regulator phasin
LRGNAAQFKKLCDRLAKLEEIVDVYATMVQKLAKAGKLQKMLGDARQRQKFEKITSKLEHQRSDIQVSSTVVNIGGCR